VRLAVLFDNFGPYHYARLHAAAEIVEIRGIETVALSTEYSWANKLESAFERITLYPKKVGRTRDLTERVSRALHDVRADAVAIPGWSDDAAFAALSCCSRDGTPAILMSESTAADELRSPLREAIKRRVVSLSATALVGGKRHVDYLVALGMPRERIYTGYDVVDNGYFARSAKEIRSRKEELRRSYALPENYFLGSARFIEKKNLGRLLRAYAEYRKQAEAGVQRSEVRSQRSEVWDLVLLGDGPLREPLNSQLSALNLHNHVHLPGFKQYDELPVYYGLAKAFVHASTTEQWGLVVNEAMASGLPVIISNRCGCVPELVREGVNGFTFNPYNIEELTSRLLAMSSMPHEELAKFGEASSTIVAKYDVDRFATGLKNAAELAINLPRKKPRIVDRALLAGLMRYPR
jgi:1,2-diacylglycerol 3-alpha-glucosyltransferase